ncbi:GNAT family N-acetyltransferase [Candidatus Berkiella cookevillensis]|uniref:GNAT family N-acetyltransferase n=1 Tax=Candidatus Berkiella cookevillensis TaxID=437022 RepID=A0A0Q9YPS0_9GAMM|nr:GNAT family protein [Candidatus Berkiella cookevillensis]MCS5707679.1 GNAT family N-acetyltransferase [Candidatus Berkiella cookevillensis]
MTIEAHFTPTIHHPKLSLVAFDKSHLCQRYVDWLNLKENVQFSELRHKTHTLESCTNYFHSMQSGKHYFWAIMHQSSGQHIGNLSAYIDPHNLIADLAILIGEPEYKGKGYGLLAWILAMDYLLVKKQFRKITAGTMSINTPMLQIFKKSDMRIEAVRQSHYLWNSKAVDIVLAAKFNPIL